MSVEADNCRLKSALRDYPSVDPVFLHSVSKDDSGTIFSMKNTSPVPKQVSLPSLNGGASTTMWMPVAPYFPAPVRAMFDVWLFVRRHPLLPLHW